MEGKKIKNCPDECYSVRENINKTQKKVVFHIESDNYLTTEKKKEEEEKTEIENKK